jgi:hypothetical protein
MLLNQGHDSLFLGVQLGSGNPVPLWPFAVVAFDLSLCSQSSLLRAPLTAQLTRSRRFHPQESLQLRFSQGFCASPWMLCWSFKSSLLGSGSETAILHGTAVQAEPFTASLPA